MKKYWASLKQRGTELSKEQKAAFVLLMFLGLGGVVLGFFSFGANLRRPFELQLARYTGEQFLTSSQREAAEIEASKTRDTDGDGLMDYDETYVFKTSAFLGDTDSDGIDDKTEVYAGQDPNCPEGKDCGRVIASADDAGDIGASPTDLLTSLPGQTYQGIENVNLNSEEDLIGFFTSMSTEDMRAALEQAGVPAADLEQIDDETLRQVFLDAVTQAANSGQFSALANQLQGQLEEVPVETTPAPETETTP